MSQTPPPEPEYDPRALRVGIMVVRIVGWAFLGLGIVLAGSCFKRSELHCDRGPGTCTVASGLLFPTTDWTFPAQELRGASVESRHSSRSSRSSSSPRLVVETVRESFSFTSYYGGQRNKHENAQKILAFVGDPTKTVLDVEQDDRWFGLLVLGMFGLLGVLLLKACRVGEKKLGRNEP